jgi:hypothetical protein
MVLSSLFDARTYVTVVEVAMEIVIAIAAISFITVLLPSTTVVPVVITSVIAASVIIIVIVAVVELAIIIAGRVPAIIVIAAVSPWIDARSHVIVVAYMVVWVGGCSEATLTRPEGSTRVLAAPASRARRRWAYGTFIGLNHSRL